MAERKCCDCGDAFEPSDDHQIRCTYCRVVDDGYDL